MAAAEKEKSKDRSKVHKLSLKGSAKLVAEFVRWKLSLLPSSHPQQSANRTALPVPILDPHDTVRSPLRTEDYLLVAVG